MFLRTWEEKKVCGVKEFIILLCARKLLFAAEEMIFDGVWNENGVSDGRRIGAFWEVI